MTQIRTNTVVSVAAIIATVLACVRPTLAQDTTFTYQGELRDSGGRAAGLFDMSFSLWSAAIDGAQIGSSVERLGIEVTEGRFTVQLDMGANAFDNSSRWLEITVESFTLSPRQPITRAPYSIQTRGIFVDDNNNVGIGTTTPQRKLDIEANEAILRLTSTDPSPMRVSTIQLKSSGISGHAPFGSIHFVDGTDTFRAGISSNASGEDAAQISMIVNPGQLPQLTVLDGSVRVKGELQVTRRSDGSTSALIAAEGADSWLQAHGGNMGIGTTSPSANLHVSGDGDATTVRISNGGGCTMDNIGLIVADICGTAKAASFYGVTSNTLVTIQNDGSGRAASFAGDVSFSSGDVTFSGGDATFNNGNVGIGTASPDFKLQVEGGTDVAPEGGGFLVVGPTSAKNIGIDGNEIMARNAGSTATLYLNNNGGDIVFGGAINIGYTIVDAQETDVACPAGTKVVGGGCRIVGDAEIRASYPYSNGWRCLLGDITSFESRTTYAICANVK